MPRPHGLPKTGGRKKGTPNCTNLATRERIEREADPIGFLCRVVMGSEIEGAKPTLDQRMNAAKVLAGKVLPDLRSVEMEHTGSQRDIIDMTDEELLGLVQANVSLSVSAETCIS